MVLCFNNLTCSSECLIDSVSMNSFAISRTPTIVLKEYEWSLFGKVPQHGHATNSPNLSPGYAGSMPSIAKSGTAIIVPEGHLYSSLARFRNALTAFDPSRHTDRLLDPAPSFPLKNLDPHNLNLWFEDQSLGRHQRGFIAINPSFRNLHDGKNGA